MGKSRQKQRTKQKLKRAMIRTAARKEYYSITIEDICKEAESYRSTFYRYYASKDELLREIENDYVDHPRKITSSFPGISSDTEESTERYRKELTADMQYHWDNRELCRILLSPGGDLYFHEKMTASLQNTFLAQIAIAPEKKKDMQAAAEFFAAGFLSSIYEWLKRGDRTPEEMAEFLLSMILEFRRMYARH